LTLFWTLRVNVTRLQIINEIRGLDINKANGPDDIPNRLLVACATSLSAPLELIFFNVLKPVLFRIVRKAQMLYHFTKIKGIKLTPVTTD